MSWNIISFLECQFQLILVWRWPSTVRPKYSQNIVNIWRGVNWKTCLIVMTTTAKVKGLNKKSSTVYIILTWIVDIVKKIQWTTNHPKVDREFTVGPGSKYCILDRSRKEHKSLAFNFVLFELLEMFQEVWLFYRLCIFFLVAWVWAVRIFFSTPLLGSIVLDRPIDFVGLAVVFTPQWGGDFYSRRFLLFS